MKKHIHLIGIGGTGISAIARVLLERGYIVSGSDSYASVYFDAITALGATTYLGHAPGNVMGADVVIRSSAIRDDNPEVHAAHSVGIPVLKRSEFLPELTEGQLTLAIAGTHGKTTTTGMLITILQELHLTPSFILGAMLKMNGTNAKAGSGEYFVIEADEYDNMFLGLNPTIAVITNIEHDHPDYFPTLQDYQSAFAKFLGRVTLAGKAVVGIDDTGVKNLLASLDESPCKILTFGLDESANYRALNITVNAAGMLEFDIWHQVAGLESKELGHARLSIPGEHNVQNALAAIAVSHLLSLDINQAITALASYQGTDRRFDIVGVFNEITIIDDYAHHPTQISTTIKAAKQRFPDEKIIVVWEPHTYSRPAAMQDDYVQALNIADDVIVTRIYAAREADSGFTPLPIVEKLPGEKARYLPDYDQLVDYLAENLSKNDVVLVLSAGNGPLISKMLLARIKARTP